MKSFIFKKILNGLMCLVALLGLFCFMSCAADAGSDSGSGNTDKLVLDFNGGKIYDESSIQFSYEQIERYVGLPIDEALNLLNFGVTKLSKDNAIFEGWTLKRNGNSLVRYLPEYGTLYAKWQSTGNQGGGGSGGGGTNNSKVTITFDFDGGKTSDGKTSITLYEDDLKLYSGAPAAGLFRLFGLEEPTKKGYTFTGWTSTKDGNDAFNLQIPSSGTHTFYAKWVSTGNQGGGSSGGGGINNSKLTVTFDFNGGRTSDGITAITLYDDALELYSGAPAAGLFRLFGLEEPTKEGYTFTGWTSTKDGNDAFNLQIPSSGTHTFYAKWVKK